MMTKLKDLWTSFRNRGRRRSRLDPLRGRAVEAAFAQWALSYDDDNNPLIAAEQPVMAEFLGDLSGAAILDVGCGTGRLMRLAARQGARRCVGLDLCDQMLRRTTGRRSRLNPLRGRVRGDMTRLPFANASFDCVIAGLAIGYVEPLDDVIREAARVLRPAGRLICSDLHPCGYWLGWRRTYQQTDGRLGTVAYYVHSFSHIYRAVRAAGFEMIDVREPPARDAPTSRATCPAALIWLAQLR